MKKILFPKDDNGLSTELQVGMLLVGLGAVFLLFMAFKAFLGVFSIGIG